MRKFVIVTIVVAALVAATFGATRSSQAAIVPPGGVAANLMLWLDASDPLGTGVAPSDGTSITTWADLSGSGNEATVNPRGVVQPNTAASFASAPTGFNGRPALRFDRIDDNSGSVYQTADLDLRASSRPDVTIFAVYRPAARSTNNGIWGIDDGGWDRFFISYIPNFGDGIDDGIVGLGPVQQGETIEDAGAYATNMMTVGYSGNVVGGTNAGETDGSFIYHDCTLERTFTDSTHATSAQTTMSIGWDGDNSVFDGYIAEVIVYDRVLTVPELDDVSRYLSTKYDLDSPGCASFVEETTTTTTTVVEETTTTTVGGDPAPSTTTTQLPDLTVVPKFAG